MILFGMIKNDSQMAGECDFWIYHITGISSGSCLLIDVEQENTPGMASPTFLAPVVSSLLLSSLRFPDSELIEDRCCMEIHTWRFKNLACPVNFPRINPLIDPQWGKKAMLGKWNSPLSASGTWPVQHLRFDQRKWGYQLQLWGFSLTKNCSPNWSYKIHPMPWTIPKSSPQMAWLQIIPKC